jgi:hypothetical protein
MTVQAREIATGVYWLPTGKFNTNVYFVRSGSSWSLIDTGWPNQGQLIKEVAESLFGPNARPASHSGDAPASRSRGLGARTRAAVEPAGLRTST